DLRAAPLALGLVVREDLARRRRSGLVVAAADVARLAPLGEHAVRDPRAGLPRVLPVARPRVEEERAADAVVIEEAPPPAVLVGSLLEERLPRGLAAGAALPPLDLEALREAVWRDEHPPGLLRAGRLDVGQERPDQRLARSGPRRREGPGAG